ncbi:MAG: cytochrome c oxidase subunit 3, partial [Alphaproteobacteria bacterium]
MADSHAEAKQPFHLVDPSPWPLFGAFSALLLACGALIVMHQGKYWLFMIGALAVVAVMFGWWRDVIKEAEH